MSDCITSDTYSVFLRSCRGKFAVDGKPALKVHPCGWVQANTFGPAQEWERITVHSLPADESGQAVVALQAWTGKFIASKPNGDVEAFADQIGEWEKWIVENHGDTFVALKSKEFGRYLCCDNLFDCGNEVRANRERVQEWELWVMVPQDQPHAYTNPSHTARSAIGGTIVAVCSVLTLGALAIPAVGFGVGGVVAGSAAAAAQSFFYGAATTGIFSACQAAGATLAWVPAAELGLLGSR